MTYLFARSFLISIIGLAMMPITAYAQSQELIVAETPVNSAVVDGAQQQSIPVSIHVRDPINPIANYRIGLRHTTMGVLPYSPSRHDIPASHRHEFQTTRSVPLPITAIPGEYEIVVQLVGTNGQTDGWLSAASPDFLEISDPRQWPLNYCRDNRHDAELLIDVPGDGGDLDLVCICEDDASGCGPIERDQCSLQTANRSALPVIISDDAGNEFCVHRLASNDSGHLQGIRFTAYWARQIISQPVSSISDGEFSRTDWESDHCTGIQQAIARAELEAGQYPADGQSAPSYFVRHHYNLRIAVCHTYQPATFDLSRNTISSISFEWDAQRAGSDRGVAIAPLVIQDGQAFWASPRSANSTSWQHFATSLEADDFVPVYASPGSNQHPDFGCDASPLTVGFVTANQTGPGSTPQGFISTRASLIDNFSAQLSTSTSCD